MLKKIKNRIEERIIRRYTEREFRYFLYPFEQIDYLISKMSIEDKEKYYEDVSRWAKSTACKMEHTEIKKLYFKELALKTKNENARSGYRLSLLFIRKLEQRMKFILEKNVLDVNRNAIEKRLANPEPPSQEAPIKEDNN